jgi:lipopolysaccharide/colanic/teichoic acid biosynthesis glycosyltransferase
MTYDSVAPPAAMTHPPRQSREGDTEEPTCLAADPIRPDRSPIGLAAARPWARAAKRGLDVSLCLVALLLTSPLWLLAAAAILLDGGRPLFHRQRRWGRGGGTFAVLKFRTMARDADPISQARQDDERVTRVGRLLRATGIDELPQLLNILRGEMSLVGPRPLAVGEVVVENDGGPRLGYEQVPGFGARLAVRPGLTGLATVYLRKDASPAQKVEEDLRYIERWSLGLDLRLIAVSIWISLSGRWERRAPKLRSLGSGHRRRVPPPGRR